jgi:hypothetical protein
MVPKPNRTLMISIGKRYGEVFRHDRLNLKFQFQGNRVDEDATLYESPLNEESWDIAHEDNLRMIANNSEGVYAHVERLPHRTAIRKDFYLSELNATYSRLEDLSEQVGVLMGIVSSLVSYTEKNL